MTKPLYFCIALFLQFGVFCNIAQAQLITVSNKCYKQIQLGNEQNDARDFEVALQTFEDILKKCSAKDGKEQGNLGKAIALNGLGEFEEAIQAANVAIKFSKNKNVMAYYARSYANRNLNNESAAREDLIKITQLTEKNRDKKARATIHAQLAQLDFQLNGMSAADSNLTKAIELDGSNPTFFVQRGDMQAKVGNYAEAQYQYDQAISLGKNDLEIYQIKTQLRIKEMNEKYRTDNIKALSEKMSSAEKKVLCTDLQQALNLGLRNMEFDLLGTMICD